MAKTLILYFSVYNSTHHLAEEISRQTGGDLMEIEPVIPYDKNRDHYDALEVGYRSIDTAQSYFNEEEVGNAIAKSGIPRSDIFLTTKIWIEHYGYESCKKSVEESLKKLKTDYLDLMVLHQPFGNAYGAWRAF